MKNFDFDSFCDSSDMNEMIDDFDLVESNDVMDDFDEDMSEYFEKSSVKPKRNKKNTLKMNGGSKKKKSQSSNDFDYDPF